MKVQCESSGSTPTGDEEKPEYRCRLVAREIKEDKREDSFDAAVGSEEDAVLALGQRAWDALDFGDVVRAYFHARARRRVYVELSNEESEEGTSGLLKKAMYGTRDAAQDWDSEYADMMAEAGFRQGSFSACVSYLDQKSVRVAARGDDFSVLGPGKSLDWFRGVV